jgi:phospholipase C
VNRAPRPRRVIARLLAGLGAALVPLCFGLPAANAAAPAETTSTRTPIKHFITLMQENHTFDNYFGTYPGANGIPKNVCMPVDVGNPSGKCVKPHHLGNGAAQDLAHSTQTFKAQSDDGKYDGFVWAFTKRGIDGSLAMAHYDDRDIPYYWNLADDNVLFDRWFTSANGGSVRNHLYWVTGAPGNVTGDVIPKNGFDAPTIFDRLEATGISWKFYVQSYDPTINLYHKGNGDHGAQVVWVPPLTYPRYLSDPKFMAHIVPLEQYYTDLANNNLPAVSYIVPSGASEHPPGSIQAGEAFVRTLIDSLERSSAWKSSAFQWSYDDWGGWYDHVVPPQIDNFGYGFRAPALLVSPYAKRGFVDHTTLDFTSTVKFIEENWNLQPLASPDPAVAKANGQRDRRVNSFMGAFDFKQGPRPANMLGLERHPKPPAKPKQTVVYVSYGVALGLPTLFIIAGTLAARRRRAAS